MLETTITLTVASIAVGSMVVSVLLAWEDLHGRGPLSHLTGPKRAAPEPDKKPDVAKPIMPLIDQLPLIHRTVIAASVVVMVAYGVGVWAAAFGDVSEIHLRSLQADYRATEHRADHALLHLAIDSLMEIHDSPETP